jgi:hypothetical protein
VNAEGVTEASPSAPWRRRAAPSGVRVAPLSGHPVRAAIPWNFACGSRGVLACCPRVAAAQPPSAIQLKCCAVLLSTARHQAGDCSPPHLRDRIPQSVPLVARRRRAECERWAMSHMDASTVNAIIAGIVGLVAGAVGSLIAPWVQWGVEKRRKRCERRTALIQRWRDIGFPRSHGHKRARFSVIGTGPT